MSACRVCLSTWANRDALDLCILLAVAPTEKRISELKQLKLSATSETRF